MVCVLYFYDVKVNIIREMFCECSVVTVSQYSCKQYFLASLLSTSPPLTSPHRIPGRCPVSNHHFLDQRSQSSQ